MSSPWQRFKLSIFPAKGPIYAAAPTQKVRTEFAGPTPPPPSYSKSQPDEKELPRITTTEISTEEEVRSTRKPNVFDKITRAAGSSTVFFVMLAIVVAWVILGLIYGMNDTWQIMMQNGSSIQVYITDILLIRQQQNGAQALMTTLAEIQSRSMTCERLLRQIPGCQWMETHKDQPKALTLNGRPIDDEVEESLYMVTGRPSRFQYVWSKMCHGTAKVLGSLYAYIFYWVGIFTWIGIGKIYDFSDTWQLYVNTATAVALTFTSVFLQNIQQQQEDNLEKCLHYALKIDAEVEHRLREITTDEKPNPIFEIAPRNRDWVERQIDNFADIMGSGIGVTLSIVVTIVWISVGPMLQFSDNWWLIIGTFTGLVGFIDGFVLRNLYCREEEDVNKQFAAVSASDRSLLDLLNVPVSEKRVEVRSLAARISLWMGNTLGSRWTTLSSVGLVFILIFIASVMKWSTTGQLLCNTPTMIIEGFLLLVLIQAHNISNEERGLEFAGVLKRRLLLNSYVHSLDIDEEKFF
ncbi:low affinity iron transporter-like protein [Tricladium varicosporioides]|nr:low affinity iron transporter-like protein [Hymenoscyphus varicosporioides]